MSPESYTYEQQRQLTQMDQRRPFIFINKASLYHTPSPLIPCTPKVVKAGTYTTYAQQCQLTQMYRNCPFYFNFHKQMVYDGVLSTYNPANNTVTRYQAPSPYEPSIDTQLAKNEWTFATRTPFEEVALVKTEFVTAKEKITASITSLSNSLAKLDTTNNVHLDFEAPYSKETFYNEDCTDQPQHASISSLPSPFATKASYLICSAELITLKSPLAPCSVPISRVNHYERSTRDH